jgi:ribonuclease P protein component
LSKLSLNKRERIKGKKSFEEIYNSGKKITSSDKRVRAIYKVLESDAVPRVKIAVAVSKRAGKAFFRNRIKRLMREAYRLNKLEIFDFIKPGYNLYILLLPYSYLDKNKKYRLEYFTHSIVDILEKIKESIRSKDTGH